MYESKYNIYTLYAHTNKYVIIRKTRHVDDFDSYFDVHAHISDDMNVALLLLHEYNNSVDIGTKF